jgi:hypothetical protein
MFTTEEMVHRHECVIGEIVEDIEEMDDKVECLSECHNNLVDIVIEDEDEEDDECCNEDIHDVELIKPVPTMFS